MKEAKSLKPLRPLKAIKVHCLDCCGGSREEVKLCEIKDCSLWIYRFGKRPQKTGKVEQ